MVTRGKSKFADYVLYYKPNIPIAIIEAKENRLAIGEGMQQALEYGEILNIPFVFSSNGDGFLFHDRTGTLPLIEQTLALQAFPRPEQLWATYCKSKGLSGEAEHRSGRPILSSVSTRRSVAAAMSSASFPTAHPCCVWSVRYSKSRTTSGPSGVATSAPSP